MQHKTRQRMMGCLFVAALFAAAVALGGCSEDAAPGPAPQVFLWDTLGKETLTPFTLSPERVGIGYFRGDATAISAIDPDNTLTQKVSTVFLRGQLSDELKIGQEGPSVALDALFAPRIGAILAEADSARAFGKVGFVLDLMRLSDGSQAGSPTPYLTTWDDRLNRTIDNYGFYRDEYREAVLNQVKLAAQTHRPDYLVIGAEMLRFLSMPGGIDDYPNYVTLYREAYDAVKSLSPSTKVGAGIDWVYLQEVVAPAQVLRADDLPDDLKPQDPEGSIPCNALPTGEAELVTRYKRACTDKAFMTYVEPLLRIANPAYDPEKPGAAAQFLQAADFLALSLSAPSQTFSGTPANCPEDYFGYLRLWSQTWPVVYYQANWQITSSVSENKQQEWLQVVIDRNQGVNVEVLAWAQLKDLRSVPDCQKLKSTDIGAPDWVCFQGMFSESGRAKSAWELLTGK
jgi:hypothetical protein